MRSTLGEGAGPAPRVLVVEDDHLVAEGIRLMLDQIGCEVVGPLPTVSAAQPVAEADRLDGAVLDVNLRDGDCRPIAEALRRRGCPFIFVTGYGRPGPGLDRFDDVPWFDKPVDADRLRHAVAAFSGG